MLSLKFFEGEGVENGPVLNQEIKVWHSLPEFECKSQKC